MSGTRSGRRGLTGAVLVALGVLLALLTPGAAAAAVSPDDLIVGVWTAPGGGVADEFKADGSAEIIDGRAIGPCYFAAGEQAWRGLTRTPGTETYTGESSVGIELTTSQGVICGGKAWRPGTITISGDAASMVVTTLLSGVQTRQIQRAPYQNCPATTAPASGAGAVYDRISVDSLGDSPYETHSFCSVPLRFGDAAFGKAHLDLRNTEVGGHEWDEDVKVDVTEALGRRGAPLGTGGGYYVYAAAASRAGAPGYQCVFVDSKSYGIDAFKGIITTYWVAGAFSGDASQCSP